MANEIPSVYIQVIADTGEVQRNLSRAEKAFLNYQNRTKKTAGLSKRISKDFAGMAVKFLAVERAVTLAATAFRTMIQDVSDIQRIRVELEVATGSAILAADAFAKLQMTAEKLPSSLKDLTTGFIRLKNMGLDASENSLVSFSNTAAAMGKSLKQFVEAVADANTREFERLKEFGILARNQGETIKFVFRNTTTEVANSSEAIVGFLTDIGNTEFAGAATNQIDTIASRTTKLRDALFSLNVAAGEGFGGAYGDLLSQLTGQLKNLTRKAEDSKFSEILRPSSGALKDLNWIDRKFISIFGLTESKGVTAFSEIEEKFGSISADMIPAAQRHMEAFRASIINSNNELTGSIKQLEKLQRMVRGIADAQFQVDLDKSYAEYIAKVKAETKKVGRLEEQRGIVLEGFQDRAFELRLRAANEQKNINALTLLEAEARGRIEKSAINLQKATTTEQMSNEQIAGFMREHSIESKTLLDIQIAIADITKEEADAVKELAEEREKARKERMEELQEQMKAAMEVGNALDYNADREKARNLASRLATSEGIELTEALEEKYRLVAGEIEDIQGKLAEGGLGAEEIIKANDNLDTFQASLDATGKAIDDQKDSMTEWQKSMVELFDDVREGIADAIVEGENFKGVLQSVLKQIAKTQLLAAIGGFGNSENKASGLLGMLKGKAIGGPVSANTPYIVGEKGPELFTPTNAGSITPNNRMGGGGQTISVVNNFAINGGDKQEMQGMIAQSVSTSVQLAVAKIGDNKRRRV